jgi:hypothetical protein
VNPRGIHCSLAIALSLSFSLTQFACGARSPLLDPALSLDARASDAAPSPDVSAPDCFVTTAAVGTVRWSLAGFSGHPAVGPDGTLYVPTVEPEGGRALAAIDPCGRLLWRAPGWVGTPATRNVAQRPYARVQDDGRPLLTNSVGSNQRYGVFRYDRDGRSLGMLSIERSLASFFGLPAGQGPLVLAWSGESTRFELAQFSLDGARATLATEFRNGEECAVSGSILACVDRAFDLRARRMLWDGPSDEIIDGTRRHVVGPALSGDTLYAMLFGIRTYVLVAKDVRSGRERWRSTLETSSSGQTGYQGGAPVVAPDGSVSVFLKLGAGAASGALRSYSPDGALRWRVTASAGPQDFLHDATHTVDRDGVHYLATGAQVIAIEPDGRTRWTLPVPAGVSRGAPTLSPFGDLYVVTNDDTLLAIVAGSPGESQTGWPSARGGARNANAR